MSRLTLHDLKADPGRLRLDNVFAQIDRLRRVRDVALPADLFAGVAPNVVAWLPATGRGRTAQRVARPPGRGAGDARRGLVSAAPAGDHRRPARLAHRDGPQDRRDRRAAGRAGVPYRLQARDRQAEHPLSRRRGSRGASRRSWCARSSTLPLAASRRCAISCASTRRPVRPTASMCRPICAPPIALIIAGCFPRCSRCWRSARTTPRTPP